MKGFLLFAAFLALYLSMIGGLEESSADLVGASLKFGSPRPPGYPLYCLLGKLATMLIRFGTIAQRHNILNAVLGALCTVLVYIASRRMFRSVACGLVSACVFGLSPMIWRFHVRTHVVASNNVLFATMLLAYIASIHSPSSPSPPPLLYLLLALSLSLDASLFFYGGGLVVALPLAAFSPAKLCKSSLFFLLGLLPLLYIPLASYIAPHMHWGGGDSLQGFITHLLQLEFAHGEMPWHGMSHDAVLANLTLCGRTIAQQLPTGVILLSGVGAYSMTQATSSRRLLAGLVVSILAGMTAVILVTSAPSVADDVSRHWAPVMMVASLLVGGGVAAIARQLPKRIRLQFVYAVLAALCAVQLRNGLSPPLLIRGDNHAADLARAVLAPLPLNAMLLVDSHPLASSIHYMQVAERVRPDVFVLSLPVLSSLWFKSHLAKHYKGVDFPGSRYSPTIYPPSPSPPPPPPSADNNSNATDSSPSSSSSSTPPCDGCYHALDFLNANFGKFRIFYLGGGVEGREGNSNYRPFSSSSSSSSSSRQYHATLADDEANGAFEQSRALSRAGYLFVPFGLVEQILRSRGGGGDATPWDATDEKFLAGIWESMGSLTVNDTRGGEGLDLVSLFALERIGEHAMTLRLRQPVPALHVAVAAFSRAVKNGQKLPLHLAPIYRSLGLACHDLRRISQVSEQVTRAVEGELTRANISSSLATCPLEAWTKWHEFSVAAGSSDVEEANLLLSSVSSPQ